MIQHQQRTRMCITGQYIWLPCYIRVAQTIFLIFIMASFIPDSPRTVLKINITRCIKFTAHKSHSLGMRQWLLREWVKHCSYWIHQRLKFSELLYRGQKFQASVSSRTSFHWCCPIWNLCYSFLVGLTFRLTQFWVYSFHASPRVGHTGSVNVRMIKSHTFDLTMKSLLIIRCLPLTALSGRSLKLLSNCVTLRIWLHMLKVLRYKPVFVSFYGIYKTMWREAACINICLNEYEIWCGNRVH